MSEFQPQRRWFQFGLRSLLVFVTLCAVLCSWTAVKLKEKREEHKAADLVLKLKGSVTYDYELDVAGNTISRATPHTPAWLQTILGIDPFSSVVEVQVNCDAQLDEIKHFPKLRKIWINCFSTVTDAGLAHLRDAPQIRELEIGVEKQFTDASLSNLRCLTKLERLDISYLKITDAGLQHLQGLTQLKELTCGSGVTDEGVKKLQEILPNCEITN